MAETKLGILAGGGELPRRTIQVCLDQERPFYVIAFKGQTDKKILKGVAGHWSRLGAGGKIIRILKKEAVREVVMAGFIRRPSLAALFPDWWTARFLLKVGYKSLGDDGILKAIIKELEQEGFGVVGADTLLPDLLTPQGCLGKHKPDDASWRDITLGVEIARSIGKADKGQGCIIRNEEVLAEEDETGTDSMLKKLVVDRNLPRGVLVKVKKPNQEKRADLPTIGPCTIDLAAAAGLAGIAIEAGSSFLIDRDVMIKRADEQGLFIVGICVS